MNYFSSIMLLAVFAFVVIQYLLEVLVGSSTSMYDAEVGVVSENSPPRKSSSSRFFGKLMPLQLTAIGIPLLAYNLFSGVLLILVSLFMFFLNRNNRATSGATIGRFYG